MVTLDVDRTKLHCRLPALVGTLMDQSRQFTVFSFHGEPNSASVVGIESAIQLVGRIPSITSLFSRLRDADYSYVHQSVSQK